MVIRVTGHPAKPVATPRPAKPAKPVKPAAGGPPGVPGRGSDFRTGGTVAPTTTLTKNGKYNFTIRTTNAITKPEA